MSDQPSPFDRPGVSEGYPLDPDEERAVREELERLRPGTAPPAHESTPSAPAPGGPSTA